MHIGNGKLHVQPQLPWRKQEYPDATNLWLAAPRTTIEHQLTFQQHNVGQVSNP